LLLIVGDFLVERVDVGGGTETGFSPRLLAELIGQPLFELADGAPRGAVVPDGGERRPSPCRRSGGVKLEAA
jgi:hypothetical protein